ncbi:hypothetical protein W97_00446 [Coniosporium apollinis CBS 100218]|uniref:Protein arginine N-methyltransferase n=1 Tax=Coniosporium apollinis (strain CBS 100218) TaxID=1168221 RepID=R7YH67_CONA1|nr:uncharacterized protein W97_00446 [Coniosporium apollinis CBS 100218]EON61233.1 hypothetical protein W97_00446 [Coniosporium apollinis CBS 100218]
MGDMPVFYVGQHESKRSAPVSEHVLQQAQDCNYDMLTTPITTSHFHSRVLTLLSSYQAEIEAGTPESDVPTPLVAPLTPADTPLSPSETISQLLAVTSPWIDLASPDPVIASLSLQVFNQEIAYAAFCGVGNVIVQGPSLHSICSGQGLPQYARAIQEALDMGPYLNLQILLPMAGDPSWDDSSAVMGDLGPFARPEYLQVSAEEQRQEEKPSQLQSWDAWNVIRSICKYSSRLSVALSLPRHLPAMSLQSRWCSEPLRLLVLPGSSFLENKLGYPVLSKPNQAFIARCMRLKTPPWLLLSDVGPIPGLNDPDSLIPVADGYLSASAAADAGDTQSPSPTPAEAARQPQQKQAQKTKNDPTPHLSYIRYLQRNQPPKSLIERFGSGYQDYLQSPLQPLTDNLESITYEVFEKDPIKYEWYERAIAQALRDWKAQSKTTSSSSGAVVVAVVGAGRGPLVTRALRASETTGVAIEAWAVEKNPNAYVLLQRHNEDTWKRQVTVVKSDMRAWKGPHGEDGTHGKVDILVSELLGSFADNELSPECLDGVQHVLNPEHGISIPSLYTAHLTPIAAPRLHADILHRLPSDPQAFDLPYVVMLHAIDFLSTKATPPAPPQDPSQQSKKSRKSMSSPQDQEQPESDIQQAWQFSHPLPAKILAQSHLRRGGSAAGGGGGATGGDGANEHNARFSRTRFQCPSRGVCHGLAGYFETVLYAGGADGEVELSTNPATMEAKSKDMISWFPIFFPLKTPIYLPDGADVEVSMWRQTDDRKVWYEWLVEAFVELGGRRVRLGISEMHSSKKNGCLM